MPVLQQFQIYFHFILKDHQVLYYYTHVMFALPDMLPEVGIPAQS